MEMDDTVDAQLALQCDVCGMRDFYQEGGFFYCSLCNTQSQQSRLFVEDDDPNAAGTGSQFRSRLAVLQDEEALAASIVGGRKKLSSWEVFNLILRALTEKLIAMGFPPLLKDVVLQLYTTYLMKRKAIFVSEKEDKPSSITHAEPITNVYALYGRKRLARKLSTEEDAAKKKKKAEEPEVDDGASATSRRRKRTSTRRKALEQEYLDYVSDGERSVRSGHGKKTEEESREVGIRKKEGKTLVFTDAYSRVRRELAQHINIGTVKPCKRNSGLDYHVQKYLVTETFTMKTVLMILFIGLRKVGARVLFSDVLRMYHEGTLRIDNIATILPEDEVNQIDLGCNEFLRCGVAGSSFKFRYFQRPFESLLSYLEITDFRYPDYKEFIPKFVDDLKLPREFECLLFQFHRIITMEEIMEELSAKSCNTSFFKLFPEFLILAMITVKLKMLFGLDGVTEKYQSRFARLANEIIDKATESLDEHQHSKKEWSKLFVIEDWFSYLRYRSTIIAKEKGLVQGRPNLQTVDHLIKQSAIVSRTSYSNQQSCNAIKSIFQEAVADLTNGQGIAALPTYETPSLPNEDVIQTYIQCYPNVAHIADRRKLSLDLFKHRIDFIFQPQKYASLLKKAGYRVKVIDGDSRNCESLNFKSNVVPLFQPYKFFDESVSSHDEQADSIKFLFSVFCSIFPGCNQEEAVEKLRNLVESIGDILNRRAYKPHNIPLVIPEDTHR